MREPSFREVYILCLFVCCLYSDVECYSLLDCGENKVFREGSSVLSFLCGPAWGDRNQEQIQNVFKRFLFHYSKAQNSVGTVERKSHSVHPLMRLSPKFTLRRKKQQLLAFTVQPKALSCEEDMIMIQKHHHTFWAKAHLKLTEATWKKVPGSDKSNFKHSTSKKAHQCCRFNGMFSGIATPCGL